MVSDPLTWTLSVHTWEPGVLPLDHTEASGVRSPDMDPECTHLGARCLTTRPHWSLWYQIPWHGPWVYTLGSQVSYHWTTLKPLVSDPLTWTLSIHTWEPGVLPLDHTEASGVRSPDMDPECTHLGARCLTTGPHWSLWCQIPWHGPWVYTLGSQVSYH